MAIDALLAILHHLAAFGLLATLAAEWALISPDLSAPSIARLGRVDRVYGMMAAAVVIAGASRLLFGTVETGFLIGNVFFWAKMAAFGGVGLLSIRPTLAYIRWNREVASDRAWQPPLDEIATARRAVVLQLVLFPVVPACAALMARGFGA